MNDKLKIITPGSGLGNIIFGMTKNQVMDILGTPDEIENFSYTDDDENLVESWHYDDLEISLGFDEDDDWILGTLSVTSSFYDLYGSNLMGLSLEEVESFLIKNGINDLELEDCSTSESPEQQLLSSESKELNFWFEKETLNEIQWGPFFKDDETIIWPSKNK